MTNYHLKWIDIRDQKNISLQHQSNEKMEMMNDALI